MPQLDIYTYFTQFQWLLLIFTLLFLLINGQFIPTFQSLFEARSALQGTSRVPELESQKGATPALESKDGVNGEAMGGGLKVFEFDQHTKAKPSKTTSKPATSSQLVVSKWDQIYDKFAKAAPTAARSARRPNKGPAANAAGGTSEVSNKSNLKVSGKKGKAQSNKKGR